MSVAFERAERLATITLRGPDGAAAGVGRRDGRAGRRVSGRCALARELDDAILDIRINEFDVAAIVFKSAGDTGAGAGLRRLPRRQQGPLARARDRASTGSACSSASISTSRSLVALVEPGSCFAGTLAELVFATDRSYMLIGQRDGDNKPPATMALSEVNFGAYPMSNGLTRLASRFLANPALVEVGQGRRSAACSTPRRRSEMGLVTFARDDIDWEDEVRVFLEERASFSPDGLTGLEANLRFGGPETMESKIFARLTAWQNWIFQRPNAVGEEGALKRYGTGQRPVFDTKRV